MGAGSPEPNFYHKFQSSENREGKSPIPMSTCAPPKAKRKRSSPLPTGEMGQWHPTLNPWA